ncbi:MAG: cryptochrome/photolyase family protein [Sphingobacteriaceae bacterium]|nr:MAG: cryptochrome/photolyase family protein [Sphingobacteriaceae bacterium]
MVKTLRLILGDQLNSTHSWYLQKNPETVYVLMEIMQEQTYVKHHVQKVLAFFAAMRNFAYQLEKAGHQVIYLKLNDPENVQTLAGNLQKIIDKNSIERFEYLLPDEYRLDQQLKDFCKNLNISTRAVDTEHFFTTREEVGDFFSGKKQLIMESFYRHMRKKYAVLMNGDEPAGGLWNFDVDNRNRYDKKVPLPEPLIFEHDLSEIRTLIDEMKVLYFGNVEANKVELPLSRKEALKLIDYFCQHLLPHFGTYEDAMLQQHASLFHSRLSFALNVKLISPKEVISQAIMAWQHRQKEITLPQIEGFVRQIMGWREYMRGLYWNKMPEFKEKNFFNHQAKLPKWFWTGETQMNCLKHSIGQSLDLGWAHHIQRLMIIGNFALLMGANPDEVDDWYLGVYVDAMQWVQLPNTRGMSQFADGGMVGTKPYVASAAYINKMSDYCGSCFYDRNKKYGEKACPYNSLYWDFFSRNEHLLASNQRLKLIYGNLHRLKPDDLEKILEQAGIYKDTVDDL